MTAMINLYKTEWILVDNIKASIMLISFSAGTKVGKVFNVNVVLFSKSLIY